MAEQGSDNLNTDASGAELVRQLLEQSTRLARTRQAGLLAAGGTLALAAVVVGTLSAALSLVASRSAVRPQAGPCGLPAVTCQPPTEEVR